MDPGGGGGVTGQFDFLLMGVREIEFLSSPLFPMYTSEVLLPFLNPQLEEVQPFP